MSLLAAPAAAYNKELSLTNHFILNLGIDSGHAKLEGPLLEWDTYFSLLNLHDENLGIPFGLWLYL